MSIVGRGLGRKSTAAALVVTAGLGRWAPPDAEEPFFPGGPDPRRRTEFDDDELIDLAITLITSGVLDE